MLTLMSKDYRVKAGSWGESKQRFQIMLTETAIDRIDAIADELKLTRSEVLERLARSPCLDADVLKAITKDADKSV